ERWLQFVDSQGALNSFALQKRIRGGLSPPPLEFRYTRQRQVIDMQTVSRRDLARSIAAGTVFVLAERRSRAEPASSAPVRKDISSLAPNAPDLVNYRKVVDLMHKLPASDPRSWQSQWNIHTANCPHGNWWFLPWHRAYLHYFELCCRDVLQDASFSLPY